MAGRRFNIVLIGDSAVGKSQLLARFKKYEFNIDSEATIGVDFHTRRLVIDDTNIKALIWDPSGQERFRAVAIAYCRSAVGAMLVYDTTNRESFEHIPRWLEEVRAHADNNIVIILIGNKTDLEHLRAVPVEDAKQFAEKEGIFFLETSALNSTNVENSFNTFLTEILNTVDKKNLASSENQGDSKSTAGDPH